MITTRELANRVINGNEVRVRYMDQLYWVASFSMRMGINRLSLAPIHENRNWAVVPISFEIPATDNDLPMWDIPA